MSRELNRYHPRGEQIVTAFVAGINAYIELTEREPGRLPLEFRILGIRPGRWTPEVVVSRHNGLFRNLTNELRHAQLVRALGADRAGELLNLHPGHPRLDTDPGLDLAGIGDAVIKPYSASRAPLRFQLADVQPEYRGKGRLPGQEGAEPTAKPASGDSSTEGSNNWVL